MMLLLFTLLLLQASNPFELPIVAALSAMLIGPTKIAVDVIKGAFPKIPGGALPLLGVIIAFGLGIVFEIAIAATFTPALYAQVALAALGGQAGAMVATAAQTRAETKRVEAELGIGKSPDKFTTQDLK